MDGGRGQASAIQCHPTTTTNNLRPVLAADADESVLLALKAKSKDDDVRTRILLLSQRNEELQDAINLACRHTECTIRDAGKPRSRHQWQQTLQSVNPGHFLWTEILAGQHHRQENFTRMQVLEIQDLVRQYEGPGKVVIIDYTSARPQVSSLPEKVGDLPPLWQELVNANNLKLRTVRLCSWGIRHSQNHRPPLGTRYLLTNLTLPHDTHECRCGRHPDDHIKLGSLRDPERQNMMLDYNVMLLLTVMAKLPNLTMSINDVKAVLEKNMPLMPSDVKDFFQQLYVDKMRVMGKEQASAPCSKPSSSVLPAIPAEGAYPTESRMKQKAKHAAERTYRRKAQTKEETGSCRTRRR